MWVDSGDANFMRAKYARLMRKPKSPATIMLKASPGVATVDATAMASPDATIIGAMRKRERLVVYCIKRQVFPATRGRVDLTVIE